MEDSKLIASEFFDYDIPKDKKYLMNFFRRSLHRAFLRYYLVFGNGTNFSDHTGYHCSDRLVFRLVNRYKKLTTIYENAKKSLTEEGMSLVYKMEIKKIPLTKLYAYAKKMNFIEGD